MNHRFKELGKCQNDDMNQKSREASIREELEDDRSRKCPTEL